MLRVALNAQGLSGIAQAILTNLLTAFANLTLPFVSYSRATEFFESFYVVSVALACVSTAPCRDLHQAVFTTKDAQLAESFSSRGALLRCMQCEYVLCDIKAELQ